MYAVYVVSVKNGGGRRLAPFTYSDGICFVVPYVDPCRLENLDYLFQNIKYVSINVRVIGAI